jgi:hypothetical protein
MDFLVVNGGFHDFHSCPQVTRAPLFSDSMPWAALRFN